MRFIPAYAGNAWVPYASGSSNTVHPRIRGERSSTSIMTAARAGSSPHTRGTRAGHVRGFAGDRFIPAYAGNAAGTKTRPWMSAVHPRIRGERSGPPPRGQISIGSSPHTRGTRGNRAIPRIRHSVHPRIRGERVDLRQPTEYEYGSSPHTRGTRNRPCSFPVRCRFIPAYAGNAMAKP